MLIALLSMSIAVPIVFPGNVVSNWSDVGPQSVWQTNPRAAAPDWSDAFSSKKEPRNIDMQGESFIKTNLTYVSFNLKITTLQGSFDYQYDDFPSELRAWITAAYNRSAQLNLTWFRPDGLNVTLYLGGPPGSTNTTRELRISADATIVRTVRDWAVRLGADSREIVNPEIALFAQVGAGMLDPQRAQILKGQYRVRIQLVAFESTSDLDGRFLIYGKVFGLAGTDLARRDLLIGILWGAPVALAFGTVAAIVSVLVQGILGAIGAWYGGYTDELIQRLADFFLILPFLPILVMISLFYRPGIWALLVVVIGFGVVGGTTKVVRSIVLQVKEELYVEVAKSYGLSRARILFKHIVPRTMPYTFALIALNVPVFIFLEASISFLGLGDPVLPTWGKIIGDAYQNRALFLGYWWWVAFPILGILFVTIAFALLGYAFDLILNPRLREE